MPTKLQKINELKNDFSSNIEAIDSSAFKFTEHLTTNFKKAFNLKGLAIAGLLGLSVNAAAGEYQSVDSIQTVYEQSLKTVSIHYSENLPTFSEIKLDVAENRTDTMLKNDFWSNNISTLIYDGIDDSLIDENDQSKYSKNLAVFSVSQSESGAFFINKKASQEKIENIYGENDYKYYFQADGEGVGFQILSSYIDKKNHPLLKDFIVYHEMAHGSFEQELSSINKHAIFNLSSIFSQEIHSDVAGALMTSKKNSLSAKESSDFIIELSKIRTNLALESGDLDHNTSLALVELSNLIKDNPKIYENLSQEKVSSFSAYFAHNLNKNFDKKIIEDSFKRLDFETDILGTKERIENIKEKLIDSKIESSYTYKSDNVADTITYNDIFETYLQRSGADKVKFFTDNFHNYHASLGQDYNAGINLDNIYGEFRSYLAEADNREIEILSVSISRKTQNMDFHKFSNTLTKLVGGDTSVDTISDFYKYNSFKESFENNKANLNKIISSKI